MALVKMYEMHVNQYHGKKKTSSEEEKSDRDRESYNDVIKERTMEACVDNRVDLLAPARFLPTPLQYQHIAKKQPARQTPVWERIDLAHYGLHLADTSIVGKIHDRCYGGIKLNYFLAMNLGVDEEDKDVVLRPQRSGTLKQTKSVKTISSMEEAAQALMNCSLIWRFIHPLDYGTEAIVRFLMNKIYHHNPQRRLTTVAVVCAFFQSAMKGNADRVLGPENPRTYQELVSFYNSMDWSSGVALHNAELSTNGARSDGKGSSIKRTSQGQDRQEKKKPKIVTTVPVCFDFNKAEGCSRADGDMCNRNGRQFMHICSRVGRNGSVCGSKEHGDAEHV